MRRFRGVSKHGNHTVQFLTKDAGLKATRNARALQKDWPPKDCSPLHPIEPWGKQFFVFNALDTIDDAETTWQPKGRFPQIPLKLQDGKVSRTSTVLCITDYKRRPYLYLNRQDFEELVLHLKGFKNELQKFKQILENEPEDLSVQHRHLTQPEVQYSAPSRRTDHRVVFKGKTRTAHTTGSSSTWKNSALQTTPSSV